MSTQRRDRVVGWLGMLIGMVLLMSGQAPDPASDGNFALSIPGLLLILASALFLLVRERGHRRGR